MMSFWKRSIPTQRAKTYLTLRYRQRTDNRRSPSVQRGNERHARQYFYLTIDDIPLFSLQLGFKSKTSNRVIGRLTSLASQTSVY